MSVAVPHFGPRARVFAARTRPRHETQCVWDSGTAIEFSGFIYEVVWTEFTPYDHCMTTGLKLYGAAWISCEVFEETVDVNSPQ